MRPQNYCDEQNVMRKIQVRKFHRFLMLLRKIWIEA